MGVLRRLVPRPDSGESRLRFVLRLIIVVLCAAALVQALRPAVYSTRKGVESVQTMDDRTQMGVFRHQLEYLSAEIERRIPAGTRILVSTSGTPEWRVRLTELATLHGVLVVVSGADQEILIEFDPNAPYGVRLVIRQAVAG